MAPTEATTDTAEQGSSESPTDLLAMRTQAYLLISLLGLGIVGTAFLPWAGVPKASGSAYDFAVEVVGVDAGGWGEAVIVAGAAIFLLGLLGYFWNPFSDPEAVFIAGFACLTLIGTAVKMLDVDGLVDPDGEFFEVDATIAPGFWLLATTAAAALVLALWILFSRPSAEDQDAI